jgi:hypothetical protein
MLKQAQPESGHSDFVVIGSASSICSPHSARAARSTRRTATWTTLPDGWEARLIPLRRGAMRSTTFLDDAEKTRAIHAIETVAADFKAAAKRARSRSR